MDQPQMPEQAQQPQPQQPQQQPPQMQNQGGGTSKWLIIVLIVVIVIAGAYFAWYYLMGPGKAAPVTPTTTTEPLSAASKSTSTNSQELKSFTYQNTDKTWGFTLKYPSDWEIDQNVPAPKSFLSKRTDDRLSGPISWSSNDKMTIEDFAKENEVSGSRTKITLENGTVGETVAGKDLNYYFFQAGTSVVMFSVPLKPTNDFNQKEIDQAVEIVRTFKPLNTDSTSSSPAVN